MKQLSFLFSLGLAIALLIGFNFAFRPQELFAVKIVPTPIQIPESQETENFILHIQNLSKKLSSIDIKVYIDGELKVTDNFNNKSAQFTSNPVHQTLKLNLSSGLHRIKATSKKANLTLEKTFQIEQKRWAILNYGEANNQFSFAIQNEPIQIK